MDVAKLDGNLWEYNFAKVVVIDVSDDYRVMQPPLPSECYPVLAEHWVPRHKLQESLPETNWIEGYLYDWHDAPPDEKEPWYVGVVDQKLADSLEHSSLYVPATEMAG